MSHYLVTGGAGFIGSWLTERLSSLGHFVTVLDDFSAGRVENLAQCAPAGALRIVRASTSDASIVARHVAQVDGVFHLASPVGVMRVLDDPKGTLANIVAGGANVSAACATYNVPLLVASSSEVYGVSPPIPTHETAPAVIVSSEPRWHYAAAKLIVEHQAMACGAPAVVVRLFNTVGPRQAGRYGMVIPRFVKQALDGRPITVFGTGEQTRSFMHVFDAVAVLHALMENPDAYGHTVNIGNNQEVSINSLAVCVRDKCLLRKPHNAESVTVQYVNQATAYGHTFQDVQRRVPETTKMTRLTGLEAFRSLEEIVEDVIDEQLRS